MSVLRLESDGKISEAAPTLNIHGQNLQQKIRLLEIGLATVSLKALNS